MGTKLTIVLAIAAIFIAVATVSALNNEEFINSLGKSYDQESQPIIDLDSLANSVNKVETKISQETKDNAYKEIEEKLKEETKVPILVWVNEDVKSSKVLKDLKNFEVKYKYDKLNGFAGSADEATIKALRDDKRVNYIVFDAQVIAHLQDSRPLVQVDVVVSNYSLQGEGVGVCHLDTGVNYNHTGLAQAYVGGWDFINNDNDPIDDNGHGTRTAGVITANLSNNGAGLPRKGMAPRANLVAVKILDSTGSGSTAGVAAGINWCITNKDVYNISVISMSLGTSSVYTPSTSPGYYDTALQLAVNNLIVPVASSGNGGSTTGISYPAVAPGVISVGAVYDKSMPSFQTFSCTDNYNYADMISCFTDRAPFLDILAPGIQITSTSSSSNTAISSSFGTSLAAPHVSGIIALMKQRNPQMTVAQIENILKSTAIPVIDNSPNSTITPTGLTFPRVNAWNAVNAVPYLNKTGSLGPTPYLTFYINSKLEPGFTYGLAMSLSRTPGIPLPDGRVIPLTIDDLLLLSIQSPNLIFLSNNFGIIDANGRATAVMNLPYFPGIENIEAYAGFITINNTSGEIASISNAVRL